MLLELQKHIIYGPVNSRRLGRSLGINILPLKKKVCTFNCVYCQYGWTYSNAHDEMLNPEWFAPQLVLEAIEDELSKCSPLPDFLTFSGNGEATMHPNFPEIVDGLIEIRNRFSPNTKTAILSNSTLINDVKIRKAIDKIEYKIMKLDAGTTEIYNRINRPCIPVLLDEIVAGLKSMKDIIIQTMWVAGDDGNFTPEHIPQWLEKISYISPRHVQIYSLDRGYPSKHISPVSKADLLKIKDMVIKEGISAEAY
jgi:wyosine [tRNA(Phe)-imidazoG37] synthetase (radical SAM superfamily)